MNPKLCPKVIAVAWGRDVAAISIASFLNLRIILPHNPHPHPYICPSFCLCSVPHMFLGGKGTFFFLSFTICKVFEPLFMGNSVDAQLLHKILTLYIETEATSFLETKSPGAWMIQECLPEPTLFTFEHPHMSIIIKCLSQCMEQCWMATQHICQAAAHALEQTQRVPFSFTPSPGGWYHRDTQGAFCGELGEF